MTDHTTTMETEVYKCQICSCQSKPGQLLLRHAVLRTVPHLRRTSDGRPVDGVREEIAREIAVCPGCLQSLTTGRTVSELLREFSEGRPIPFVPEDRPPPPPPPKVNVPIALGGKSAGKGISDRLVNTFRR